jgi:hypothetical protein
MAEFNERARRSHEKHVCFYCEERLKENDEYGEFFISGQESEGSFLAHESCTRSEDEVA